MKTLLLMPDLHSCDAAPSAGGSPLPNACALASALGGQVDVLGHDDACRDDSPAIRLARHLGGPDAALAALGWARSREYDVVFSGSEGVGLSLALLYQTTVRRPAHVMLAHRLSAHGARHLVRPVGLRHCIDSVLVHAQAQRDFAEDRLGLAPERLTLLSPPVDDRFFRPCPNAAVREDQVCAAGLQWRDYPTLLEAVAAMPGLSVRLATFPAPVRLEDLAALAPEGRGHRGDFSALRALYAESQFVAVPLCEADFAAGATTILQAMAMGKAVIATRTEGQTDVIVEGVTGLSVLPGDVAGWRRAIARLRGDAALRERLGRNARRWVEEHAALDRWAARVAETLRACAASRLPVSDAGVIAVGMKNSW